jgi:hypothetical protein
MRRSNRIRTALFVAGACAAFSATAQMQMYKWVDEKGVTNYSSTPPKDGKSAKAPIVIEDRISVSSAPVQPAAGAPSGYDRLAALERQLQAERDALRHASYYAQPRTAYDQCVSELRTGCDALLYAGSGYGYGYPVVLAARHRLLSVRTQRMHPGTTRVSSFH